MKKRMNDYELKVGGKADEGGDGTRGGPKEGASIAKNDGSQW